MRAQHGRIEGVEAVLEGERLKVRLTILVSGQGSQNAYLPEREVAALLPRSVLAGASRHPPEELLGTLQPILTRLVNGRTVRLWRWQERSYASFLPWRSLRFAVGPAGTCGGSESLSAPSRG